MGLARPAAAGVSVLLMAVLAFEAFRLGVADEIVGRSNETMESAAWRKSPPSLEAWLAVRNDLLEAVRLAPGSPGAYESLGVLHARRAASPEMLAYARDYFIAALERRPTSPYTWANHAETRYLAGERGPGVERALVRAAELGPWEPEVQRLVSDIGLALFGEAQPETSAAIERTVGFGMRRQPAEILQVAQRRGRLDVACRHVAGNKRVTDPKWIAACEKGSVASGGGSTR